MARRSWEAGLSRLAVAGFIVQGIVIAALLGIAAEVLGSNGWFATPHRRALLWDDVAVITALLCGVPVLASLIGRRSSAVTTSIVITIAAFLVLLAMRPSQR